MYSESSFLEAFIETFNISSSSISSSICWCVKFYSLAMVSCQERPVMCLYTKIHGGERCQIFFFLSLGYLHNNVAIIDISSQENRVHNFFIFLDQGKGMCSPKGALVFIQGTLFFSYILFCKVSSSHDCVAWTLSEDQRESTPNKLLAIEGACFYLEEKGKKNSFS